MPTTTRPDAATRTPDAMRALLQEGIQALEQGDGPRALGLFRWAAVAGPHDAEPWFWTGRVHEERGDAPLAAQSYYLANEIRRHGPSLEALKRLGYRDESPAA
jgi:Flp pilus assembly protein TadD